MSKLSDSQLLKFVIIKSLRKGKEKKNDKDSDDSDSKTDTKLEIAFDSLLKDINPKELFENIQGRKNFLENYLSNRREFYEELIKETKEEINECNKEEKNLRKSKEKTSESSSAESDAADEKSSSIEELKIKMEELKNQKQEVTSYGREKKRILAEISSQIKQIRRVYYESRILNNLNNIYSMANKVYSRKITALSTIQKNLA